MTGPDGAVPAYPNEGEATRDEIVPLATINTCFGAIHASATESAGDAADGDLPGCELSVRALNVLKLLAAELTGEDPPRKDWVPPNGLLREVTFERLARARNCGPLTAEEIIRWARSRGITIAQPSWIGKSVSEMWRSLEAKFAAGESVQAAVAEALDRSVRRKSTRIPIAVQRMLIKLLADGEGNGGSRRS